MLQLHTLENESLENIRHSFNEAFREYFVPVQFTSEQLEQKLFVEGTEETLQFMQQLGLKPLVSQYEMVLRIA